MSNKTLNPRTARTPAPDEVKYVIAAGAPSNCYDDGYGLVGPGAIVSLAPGVEPGKWMVEVSPEDAAKAGSDESDAQRLAVMAAAKIKEREASGQGNAVDRTRKQAADEAALADRAAAEKEAAQREADAIKRVAEAEAKVKASDDATAAEKKRADDAEARAKKAEAELAKLQQAQDKAGK